MGSAASSRRFQSVGSDTSEAALVGTGAESVSVVGCVVGGAGVAAIEAALGTESVSGSDTRPETDLPEVGGGACNVDCTVGNALCAVVMGTKKLSTKAQAQAPQDGENSLKKRILSPIQCKL